MDSVSTLKGTFTLSEAAYALAEKIGDGAKELEHERIAREAIFSHFFDHPEEVATLINIGFIATSSIGRVTNFVGLKTVG